MASSSRALCKRVSLGLKRKRRCFRVLQKYCKTFVVCRGKGSLCLKATTSSCATSDSPTASPHVVDGNMTSTIRLPRVTPVKERSQFTTRARRFPRTPRHTPGFFVPNSHGPVKKPKTTTTTLCSAASNEPMVATSWLLDTPGCLAHRTDECGGFDAFGGDDAAHRCPPKPIDLQALCDDNGVCEIGNALFSVEKNGKLFVANAHAAALDELEKRKWFAELQEQQARDMKHGYGNPSKEYDSFVDLDSDECETPVVLADGDEVCGFEDDDDVMDAAEVQILAGDEGYALRIDNSEMTQEEVQTRQDEDTDSHIKITAVRVDGLRLKPFGKVELLPGALVDLGDVSTHNAGQSVYAPGHLHVYEGVYEVNRVAARQAR